MSAVSPAPAAMAVDDAEDDQLASMSTDDIVRASRLLENEIRVHKEELQRSNLELESVKEKIKENQEKIKLNKQLPYLVGNGSSSALTREAVRSEGKRSVVAPSAAAAAGVSASGTAPRGSGTVASSRSPMQIREGPVRRLLMPAMMLAMLATVASFYVHGRRGAAAWVLDMV